MQRLVSLGLLVAVVGGGWSLLNGLDPGTVRQAAKTVGTAISQQVAQAQAPTQPPAYGQPSTPGYGVPQRQTTAAPTGVPGAPGYGAFGAAPAAGAPPTIRIASFNIQTFGDKKASRPDVMWRLAQIVRSFDVLAIQEIRTQDDYFISKFLRDYVNRGVPAGGELYDARVSERLGRTSSTEQYAYVFNTARVEAHPNYSFVVPDPEDRLHRPPYVSFFRTRVAPPLTPFTFLLLNVHTDPDEALDEMNALYPVYQQAQRATIGGVVEDDVILLGDLNTAVAAPSRYQPEIRSQGLLPRDIGLLARVPGISPLVRSEATNTIGNRLHDNLLIPSYQTIEFTGRSGVFDLRSDFGEMLTLDAAKRVSDHLPVWGEFSAVEGAAMRSVASRR
ncbi:MAG: endonuclease/exonuclease/phosphatase family protein [Planctomycetota bacterium]